MDKYFSEDNLDNTFDAESLLSQVIDKIKADKVELKIQDNDEDDEAADEIAKQEAAADRERLMIGLI